jgi:hypothetical protein
VRELGVIAITASMAHLYLTVQNPIRYLSTWYWIQRANGKSLQPLNPSQQNPILMVVRFNPQFRPMMITQQSLVLVAQRRYGTCEPWTPPIEQSFTNTSLVWTSNACATTLGADTL